LGNVFNERWVDDPWERSGHYHSTPVRLIEERAMKASGISHPDVVGGETNGYWQIMGCNYQKTGAVDAYR